jgi:hypothetical protein
LWVQDFNVFAFPGGAERNDRKLIHEGIRRRHDITMELDANWDCALISNCVEIEKDLMDNICNKKKHIFFMHDYIFCRYRLFFPCLEKCKHCPHAKLWKKRFLDSKLIIYLSPLHKEFHERVMPELKDIPNILVPSTVEPNRFRELADRKKIPDTGVSINSLLPFKGAECTLDYMTRHPEIQFQVISPNPENFLMPPNVELVASKLPYHQLLDILSSAEFYVELPETPQPYNRTFAEAKLAGCKVITNELSGAASYPWFSNRQRLIQELLLAPATFWKGVEAYGK